MLSLNKNRYIKNAGSMSNILLLPSPNNLSLFWNFGSLLGLCLAMQIISGLMLACFHGIGHFFFASYYLSNYSEQFTGFWTLRYIHMNGASLYFIFMYMHIGRSVYYGLYMSKNVWMSGVTMLLISMAIAFLGYVLPMGQMSLWGLYVITNLFFEIPFIGADVVHLLWGGFNVGNVTFPRFYALHYFLPFMVLGMILLHLIFLHHSGSSNPLGVSSTSNKVIFSSYYGVKDLLGFFFLFFFFFILVFYKAFVLGDVENFNSPDFLVTPHHIQPEWYFLFSYSILRAIPNKVGGIIAMAMSIIILYFLPFIYKCKSKSMIFWPMYKNYFWFAKFSWLILIWLGTCSVEAPYIFLGQCFTFFYFSFFYFIYLVSVLKFS